jgi:hypothetical protein
LLSGSSPDRALSQAPGPEKSDARRELPLHDYGRKMEYFAANPLVSVEIEEYMQDLSSFIFVSLQVMLKEVQDPVQKRRVLEQFVAMIKKGAYLPMYSRLSATLRLTLWMGTSERSVLRYGNWPVSGALMP